jgi:hypothetical protein
VSAIPTRIGSRPYSLFATKAAYAPAIRNAGCAMFAMSSRPKIREMPRLTAA